jgi:hypothetical protein
MVPRGAGGGTEVIAKQLFVACGRGCHPIPDVKWTIAASFVFWLCNPACAEDAQTTRVIAVAPFEYIDTSGEARNQRKEHEERLRAFSAALQHDLAATGKYGIVSLDCKETSCSDSSQLLEARRSHAEVVIFGGIHKMSTLIQWIKVAAVDTEAEKPVFERLLTFRGDSNEAWSRAEKFLAQEIASAKSLQKQ